MYSKEALMSVRRSFFSIVLVGLVLAASGCKLGWVKELAQDCGDGIHAQESFDQSLDFTGLDELRLDNGVGRVEITGWDQPKVELLAVKKAKRASDLQLVKIAIEKEGTGLRIRTEHSHKCIIVDYKLKVPPGARLNIDNGVGEIEITEYNGSLEADLGVGDLNVRGGQWEKIGIDVGVGEVRLENVLAHRLDIALGTGDVRATVPATASMVIDADVGLGDVDLIGFPETSMRREGFIGESVSVLLSAGEDRWNISVGTGDVRLTMLQQTALPRCLRWPIENELANKKGLASRFPDSCAQWYPLF
jgi:hypothetical protein